MIFSKVHFLMNRIRLRKKQHKNVKRPCETFGESNLKNLVLTYF